MSIPLSLSSKETSNKIGNDEKALEKFREIAKRAGIYHRDRVKFVRNENLSHVVHAGLHIFQFIIGLAIILFHHIHHYVNRQFRKEDEFVPHLPEEGNPIFLIYFLCMLASLIFANIWIFTNVFMKDPRIVLVGCFVAAILMLLLGIIEMKHVDWYLDITLVTDEELLRHPIFIHNFVMCLMSIFCMSMYLIQGWILLDYYVWIKKQRDIDDFEVTDSETRTDTTEDQDEQDRRLKTKERETPGELDPIPTLNAFPSLKVSQTLSIDEEDVIFYCCFVDWYNYLKQKRQQIQQPSHEFQVIHVM